MKKNVYIAVSGGIDSSVAALLLKKEGYDCTGIHFKLNSSSKAKNHLLKAKNICKHLNIPFKTYDLRKEFGQKVKEYFIKEYKSGRTPNPCIVCNEKIKFGLFFDKAIKEGADFIATGHYAKIAKRLSLSTYQLLKAKDKGKNQSYFLHRLNQKQLSKTLFLLGEYTKEEVKKLAKKYKLPTENSRESQDICFLENKSTQQYLSEFIRSKEGKIVDAKGNVLGTHKGYFKYTIGQREGLGLSEGPFYVVGIDAEDNVITVTNSNKSKQLVKSFIQIDSLHWISGKSPKLPLKCEVSIRYNHKPVKATLEKSGSKYTINFNTPVRAPTPGQSAVIYKKNECLGGGVIK